MEAMTRSAAASGTLPAPSGPEEHFTGQTHAFKLDHHNFSPHLMSIELDFVWVFNHSEVRHLSEELPGVRQLGK
jgi:hypothetical protein